MKEIMKLIMKQGHAYIRPSVFHSTVKVSDYKSMMGTYQHLAKDPSPGNRFRAYTRFKWCAQSQALVKDKDNNYFQSEEYNYADGGKIRRFEYITDTFLHNPLIKKLLTKDVEMAKFSNALQFNESLEVGLHQIRYAFKSNNPAYSSPNWLHKDDETLVFVHLMNLSKQAVGADNIISKDQNVIDQVFRLQKPFESFAVNQSVYHAVTPMSSPSASASYRDILLVTFFNRQPKAKSSAVVEEVLDASMQGQTTSLKK